MSASLLNTMISLGPKVFLAGAFAALAALLFRPAGQATPAGVLRQVAVVAGLGAAGFAVGTALGIAAFCSSADGGNLCGLGGVFGTGPLLAGLCMGIWSIRSIVRARSGR